MKKLIILLFFLTITGNIFCQNPNWIIFNSSNSGLPNDRVRTIEIDTLGDKWIGTVYGGVAKFDNSTWEVFNTSNSELFISNIQSIYIDSLNNKWFGSGWTGEISKFDGINWTVYDSENTNGVIINEVKTSDIISDKFGNLLIGTGEAGIRLFDGTTWGYTSIPGSFIYDLTLDENQDLWIGYWNDGATFYDGANSTNYNTSNSVLPSNDITSIAVENSGIVWFTTRYDGIVKYDGINWSIYNNSTSPLPSNSFNCVDIDDNNNKWFATGNGGTGSGDGIVKYDDISWVTYDTSNSDIPSNDVISFAVDGNNNLWLGTEANGVGVFNEGGVTLSINDNLKIGPGIKVFPNPFISYIEFQFEQKNIEGYDLKISTSMGQVVLIKKVSPHTDFYKMDLSRLSSGLYFATIINRKGETIIKKIIKR